MCTQQHRLYSSFCVHKDKESVGVHNAICEIEVESTGHLEDHGDPSVPCQLIVDYPVEVCMVFPATFRDATNRDGG